MIVAVSLMIIFGILYKGLEGRWGKRTLVFKAAATAVAVAVCLLGTFEHPAPASLMVSAGLICCMAADVLLEIAFIPGGGLFGAGHIFLTAAYWIWNPPSWKTLALFLIVYVVVFLMFRKDLPMLGRKKGLPLVYLFFLGAMSSMAVSLYLDRPSVWTGCAAAGGICFLLSDVMIAWRVVKKRKERWLDRLLLTLYYAAVYLIACAVYFQ